MSDWASTLLGSGLVGTPILTLVLTGRLIPVWVVRKQTDALEKSQAESIKALKSSHEEALAALNLSHQRELNSKDQAQRDVLTVRDREAERLAQTAVYEREAKGIERNRADAATGRLADLAGEFGANHRKLLDALSEAAGRDGV